MRLALETGRDGEVKTKYKRIVIKIGSNTITSEKTGLDLRRIEDIAEQITALMGRGIEVVVVSSGAISAGVKTLGFDKKPNTVKLEQACASVGQVNLMDAYKEYFSRKNIHVGQILITQEDFQDRKRYINARHTINKLLEMKVVPIINENDTISVEDIEFGDNDNLSAQVANLLMADLLLILSDVDGLYDKDPGTYNDAQLVKTVTKIDDEIERSAGGSHSGVGKGGMCTKIQAVKKVITCGIKVIITNGKKDGIIVSAVDGGAACTTFFPYEEKLPCRKRWIAFSVQPNGKIFVDAGAENALRSGNKNLLPSGIKRTEGDFSTDDVVIICNENGLEFSRGLVNYSNDDIQRIIGRNTSEIEDILGHKCSDEIINRDDLVITEEMK